LIKYAGNGVSINKTNDVHITDSSITINHTGLYLDNASPTISNCIFSHNGVGGIFCNNHSSPIIQNGTISYNGMAKEHFGILCKNYSNPVISNNVLEHNGGCVFGQDLNSFPVYEGNKLSENKYNNAIGITGGNMTTSGTWTNRSKGSSIVYLLFGDVTINKGVTLEIEPGIIVKTYSWLNLENRPPFWVSGAMEIRGRLLAKGTEKQPIVWTSFFDDSYGGDTNNDGTSTTPTVDWQYIKFDGGGGIMDHCIIKYAGRCGNYWVGYYESRKDEMFGSGGRGNIWIHSGSPTIQNCYISDGGIGVSLSGENAAQPIIRNNIITNNSCGIYHRGNHAAYSTSPIAPLINYNYIYGNGSGLGYGEKGTYTLNAQNNWWGTSSGPTHIDNYGGMGDKITESIKGSVIYKPYLIFTPPVLSWTLEEGFLYDGLEPEVGTQEITIFIYSVKYTDLDGDIPEFVKVIITDLLSGTRSIPLSYVKGSITTGAIYQATTTLSFPGTYTYFFFGKDSHGNFTTGVPGTESLGPIVIFATKVKSNSVQRMISSQFPEDLTGVYVYPNPTDGSKLIFAGLTRNVRIQVFTLVGERVFDIDVTEPNKPDNGKWTWDCRGSDGQRLASGIYIYLLTNNKGQKKTGKIGIVR
jgi:parallel beta-helix repeat protein